MQRDATSHARKASHANGFDLNGPERKEPVTGTHYRHAALMRDGVMDADLSRSSFVLVSECSTWQHGHQDQQASSQESVTSFGPARRRPALSAQIPNDLERNVGSTCPYKP